jgi:ketosteroid isomerase-like protein
MTHLGGGHGALPQFDMRGSMWSVHHALARLGRGRGATVEQRLRLVEEELAAMDLLARYTYFYDGGDLDGVMSVFHDDCVLINPRGTYVGTDAIRRNYAFLISLSKIVLHFTPNVAVRIAEDASEAWMTAYYYAMAATNDAKLVATGGTYADRLVKVGRDWKIIERRITYNFRHTALPEAPGNTPAPPPPTKNQSSRDIIGPDAEM